MTEENSKDVKFKFILALFRFFLLPALLAGANGKLYDEIGGANRAETIAVQEAYLRDFLQVGIQFESENPKRRPSRVE